MAEREAAVDFRALRGLGGEVGLQFFEGVDLARVGRAVGLGAGEEVVLDGLQALDHGGDEFGARDASLLAGVATGDEDGVGREVARADFDAQGDALLDPAPGLVAAADVAVIDRHDDLAVVEALGGELLLERLAIGEDVSLGGVVLIDRADHHVLRGEAGRSHEAVVVGVRHDHAADEAGGHAPRGRVRVLLGTLLVLELDVAGLGEVLAEVVRGAGLEGLAILHHRFDAERVDGAGETFALGLTALDDRHRHVVLGEVGIHLEHLVGLLDGLGFGRVDGMAFLPEELGGAEEEARAHLPADDVGPLIDEDREVAVGLHPLGVSLADDGLGSRADDERLFELTGGDELAIRSGFEARVGDDGAFLGEAVDVRGFLLDVADRDEEREVGVHVAGLLEHRVEVAVDVLPEGVTPRLDHHATTDRAVLGQVGVLDHLQIPLGIVILAGRGDGGLRFGGGLLGHKVSKERRRVEGQEDKRARGRVSTAC